MSNTRKIFTPWRAITVACITLLNTGGVSAQSGPSLPSRYELVDLSQQLASLPLSNGFINSMASDINEQGDVIGTVEFDPQVATPGSDPDCYNKRIAVVFKPGQNPRPVDAAQDYQTCSMRDLGTMGLKINNNGASFGYRRSSRDTGNPANLMWTAEGQPVTISLPTSHAYPEAINSLGQVVIQAPPGKDPADRVSYIWDPQNPNNPTAVKGQIRTLNSRGQAGGARFQNGQWSEQIFDINTGQATHNFTGGSVSILNEPGDVVITRADAPPELVRSGQTTGAPIGALPGMRPHSIVCDLNDQGVTVGVAAPEGASGTLPGKHNACGDWRNIPAPLPLSPAWRAVIAVDGQMHDLNHLVRDTAGLTLVSATGINSNKQITATAVDAQGQFHAVLLKPVTQAP